jgi:membrane protein insertase Oxa1/YidC/SpoIIIJ
MMKILPFMLPVISFFYPAGLGLYYFIQGLARIGTQSYITRRFYGDDAPGPVVATSKEVSTNGSKPAATEIKASAQPAIERKPGSSTKSQAIQKKRPAGGGSTSGRRSGEPRGGRPR